MNKLIWLLKWMLRAAIFFALLVFALNNQTRVTLNLFFDYQWTAPLVFIVLVTFALGWALGVVVMLPRWLSQRNAARKARRQLESDSESKLGMSTQFMPSTPFTHDRTAG
ncbi:lipopolysaccharide assembly LapA domain-containing protein [Hylemonella sp. W303a]|uniref:LapA family protein n=1 Tax=Hylemonella sp. W303a TaxID=3389873 RepID=UPI00396B174E